MGYYAYTGYLLSIVKIKREREKERKEKREREREERKERERQRATNNMQQKQHEKKWQKASPKLGKSSDFKKFANANLIIQINFIWIKNYANCKN